jgi:hypothetical protein
MRLSKFLLGFLLLAISAFAADVDGKWTGSVSTPNGDFPQTFNFKTDGPKLSGSLTIMEGMDVPISNGKIDGNNVSFTIMLDFGMPVTITYTGVISGAELKIKGDVGGMPFEFVLKKA